MTALAEPESNVELQPTREGSTGSAMIVFEDVRKVYETNNVRALDGVSFVIEKGEFVFVVGASGSGKSTLIRLLLKEVEPTGGRIVGGRDLGGSSARRCRSCAGTSAASSRTSSSSRTAPRPRTSATRCASRASRTVRSARRCPR